MILDNFKDFPTTGRLLGIDWGARRIGAAVCDETRTFVFPRGVVTDVLGIANEERVVGIVIGLPVRSDGSESETSAKVREFANSLKTDLPIVFIHEDLTSHEAAERIRENKKRGASLDAESAVIILENAIGLIARLHK